MVDVAYLWRKKLYGIVSLDYIDLKVFFLSQVLLTKLMTFNIIVFGWFSSQYPINFFLSLVLLAGTRFHRRHVDKYLFIAGDRSRRSRIVRGTRSWRKIWKKQHRLSSKRRNHLDTGMKKTPNLWSGNNKRI